MQARLCVWYIFALLLKLCDAVILSGQQHVYFTSIHFTCTYLSAYKRNGNFNGISIYTRIHLYSVDIYKWVDTDECMMTSTDDDDDGAEDADDDE